MVATSAELIVHPPPIDWYVNETIPDSVESKNVTEPYILEAQARLAETNQ